MSSHEHEPATVSDVANTAAELILAVLRFRGYRPEIVAGTDTETIIGATSPDGVDLSITVGRTS